jgi:AcrR family transcriptional regulator
VPKQERSRERIDEILNVAMDLIGRKGIDAVTMKEIAALSGGPIASVYQYFPNKSAIIGMLYEQYAEEVRDLVADHLSDITTAAQALNATDLLLDARYQKMREKPSNQDLLNAIQADKALTDLDIAETRLQSNIFYQATEQFVEEKLLETYARTLFVMFHMIGAALRLALLVPEAEAPSVISQFKSIMRSQGASFLTGSLRNSA